MRESDAALIDEFIDALWLADGLSKNTLGAYRSDLALFAQWLDAAPVRPELVEGPHEGSGRGSTVRQAHGSPRTE